MHSLGVAVSLGVTLVLAAAAAVLAAAETAVLMLPAGRIHRLEEAARRGAVALAHLATLRHRLRAVATLTGLAAAGAAAVSWVVVLTRESALGALSGALVVAGVAAAVALTHALTQALPRTVAIANPERIALESSGVALALTRALYPVIRVLGGPWRWLVSVIGGDLEISPWAVTPEWRIGASDEQDERDQAEEALLEAVSDFGEKVAREVMVPRTDMKALPDTATIDDAVDLIAETGFTRIPVYRDTIDDIRGVLYAKDLLGVLRGCDPSRRAIELARTPLFVPETKPVEELLSELQRVTHLAIVADEYGGTAGLVTLEDLLEEIVGEISDEYDREEPLMTETGEGRFLVDARLPVDDLNETFGTDLEIEADSVGGLFTEVAGRIPEQGESIVIDGLLITVTRLEGTRIRQLAVEPVPPPEGDTDA
jgi:CBS domain containing-hemolysin-like protein